MKNQYVGDIGDYTKIGLLRVIANAGLHIGLNWYLTPNDDRSDGLHTQYLHAPCDTPDFELYSILKNIIKNDLRDVSQYESSGVIKDAVYFSELLDFSNCIDNKLIRTEWHNRAIATLNQQDVIFLDPDNGLEVKSVRSYSKQGCKYTMYQEVVDYYRGGASVIVYTHRDRSPEDKYKERFTYFKDMEGTAGADIFCIKASRFSVRDYLFVAQQAHSLVLRMAIDNMLQTGWRKYLSYRNLS